MREAADARVADGAFRRRIREAAECNLLVEAAAGTGKTSSLVDRMVALVGSGTPVERICAVTFTIKAAAQLDQRFQNALEAAARAEDDPERRRRFEEALKRLDACFIGTIHAFCSRLLRERPVEAGLDPGFTEMDEAEDLAQRAEAWKRYGDRLYTEGSPILARLLQAGMELSDLRHAYELLCENTDVVPVAAAMDPPDLSGARVEVESYIDAALSDLPREVPRGGWDRQQQAIRAAHRMRGLFDLGQTPDLARVLRELAHAGKTRPASWPDKAARRRSEERFEQFRAAALEPALTKWREYLHPIAIAAIRPALADYETWRRREARLNFQDQLVFARNLLRDRPEVRRALQARFTPVLVDEFQDTDPIQAEVLLYLTGRDVHETDWRRLEPVPGSLFVVGDPKQSIYRFRRADIQTYDTVSEILQKSGGDVLRLSTNFRSTPELCRWVNAVFAGVFPAERTPSQARHVALEPFREPEGGEAPVFRIETPSRNRSSEVAQADAERVADAIAAGLRGEPPLGRPGASASDYLVLARRRANLPGYARALEARGIPYEIAGGGGAFKYSEEVGTLVCALEAIADPENPVPLVAALRGALFGIDDESLYRFQRAGGRFDLRSTPPPRSDPRIRRAYALLAQAAEWAGSLPPAAAVARFVNRLGAVAFAAAGSLGDARAGNLVKALAAARELSRERASFAEIVGRLRELTEDDRVEEMVTRPGRSDVVRLMTLHRAKGLESRVVFLADPTDGKEWKPEIWIDRSIEPPVGHVLITKDAGSFSSAEEIARPLGWEEKQALEQEFLDCENDRLLYVAATRARDALVVSFRRNQKGDVGGPWRRLDPHVRRELPKSPAADSQAAAREPGAAEDLERFREELRKRWQAAGRESYASASVTALAHAGVRPEDRPFVPSTGRGMSWGSALHRLLEAAMRDPGLDLRGYAANVLREEDRPPEDLEAAVTAVDGVRGSPLWKRAIASPRCLVEVPFAVSLRSSELGLAEEPPETLLSGAIDLVFEESGDWVLVDYKSDTVDGNLDALVSFYTPQLEQYRRIWSQLTRRPTRAGLYFLDGGREVWLD
jgi:ATP-dependent helicase/nuclease subunit A